MTWVLFIFLMTWTQTAQGQDSPGFSSVIESKSEVGELLIQAISSTVNRYSYSEIDQKSRNGVLFMDIHVEDTFFLEPLPAEENTNMFRYGQGSGMWERLFLIENELPANWDDLVWPELLLSMESGGESLTLVNASEVRSFLEARFDDLESRLNGIDSLKQLVYIVGLLKNTLKDDSSLASWVTRPIELLGHGKIIQIPVKGDSVLFTQIMIDEEEADSLRIDFKVIRSWEGENIVRYTQEELQDGRKAFLEKLTGTESSRDTKSSGKEERLFRDHQYLMEYNQHHEASISGGGMTFSIVKGVKIRRLEE